MFYIVRTLDDDKYSKMGMEWPWYSVTLKNIVNQSSIFAGYW